MEFFLRNKFSPLNNLIFPPIGYKNKNDNPGENLIMFFKYIVLHDKDIVVQRDLIASSNCLLYKSINFLSLMKNS